MWPILALWWDEWQDDTLPITGEVQQLDMSGVIELWEMDLTPLGEPDIYRFHDGTNLNRQPVVWQGNTYVPFPIAASGFDMSTNGQLPRPKLQVANVQGSITALLLIYSDLIGAKMTRRRTLMKYLDAVNFPGGINPSADPDASFADDIFFIDRKSTETDEYVEFELAAAFDVSGVMLPRRKVMQNLCPWRYRGAECGYTGPPIADVKDGEISPSVAQTPEEIAYFTARTNWINARNARITASQAIAGKQNALTVASEIVLLSTTFNRIYPGNYYVMGIRQTSVRTGEVSETFTAYYNSQVVPIGSTYRVGALQDYDRNRNTYYYSIQVWGVNTASQSAAQSAYNIAKSALTAAQGTEAAALATYQAAILALPQNGAVYSADVCGKRLTSCKKRFQQPDQSGVLPFGGFPAVGLVS